MYQFQLKFKNLRKKARLAMICVLPGAFAQGNQNSDDSSVVKQAKSYVEYHNDFPKPGVRFQDVLPIFRESDVRKKVFDVISRRYKGKVDVIVGLDARGFLVGAYLSEALDVPFVPVRKKGKLPGKVYTATFSKEYGEDAFEISVDSIPKGSRVLIVDDLIATGGSAIGAVTLVRKINAEIVEFFAFAEISELAGCKRLDSLGVKCYIFF